MTRKIAFFEGWYWFKFNNLGLALGKNLNFCTCVTKVLKLKVRKFWGPNPTFVEVTGEKLVGGGAFWPLPTLNRVKDKTAIKLVENDETIYDEIDIVKLFKEYVVNTAEKIMNIYKREKCSFYKI